MKDVIFDFDGTLTEKGSNLWKTIWQSLGYDVGKNSYYASLFNKSMAGEITHRQWCTLTCDAFKEKNFTKQKLYELTNNIKLINGADQLIYYLYTQNIELHIVSGNIVSVIKKVLGENAKYFSAINGNEFMFDNNGNLTEIMGTKYDHEGKATYIKELCEKKR